jgi:DNA-binding transcriptional ArsR family regulator
MSVQQAEAEDGEAELADSARVFAALGDRTRLDLVLQLAGGKRLSISRLTGSTAVTRQAVRKHLEVLAEAGIGRGTRQGREHLWQLEVARLGLARRSLDRIAQWWDVKLAALQAAVEQSMPDAMPDVDVPQDRAQGRGHP